MVASVCDRWVVSVFGCENVCVFIGLCVMRVVVWLCVVVGCACGWFVSCVKVSGLVVGVALCCRRFMLLFRCVCVRLVWFVAMQLVGCVY